MIILPVGLAAIAVGELLLPLLLASQRPELLEVARLFMLTIVVVMLYDLLFGMLLGDHGELGARTTTFPVQRACASSTRWQWRSPTSCSGGSECSA